MTDQEILDNLVELAKELCEEGCHGGIFGKDEGRWFKAWAEAMRRVANGAAYTPTLVQEIFRSDVGSR